MNRNPRLYVPILIFCVLAISSLMAHEGHKHGDTTNVSLPVGTDEFSSYHPLAVHFPIVLLIIAALVQLITLFYEQRGLHFLVAGATVAGFIGAYISSTFLHPHTITLSPSAENLLKTHEQFASYTVWLSGVAGVLKMFSLFKKKKITEILVAVILLITAVTVSIAGHHGAELVHKFGIGPKGNYLEQNHNH